MENKLKAFILNNIEFYNLAKKYTFYFREFSATIDYCEIKWNHKTKEWEYVGELTYDQEKDKDEKLLDKKNSFFLILSIPNYSWGTLFAEMEARHMKKFIEELKKTMTEEKINELIENEAEKYLESRNEYFRQYKIEIIDDWFKLDEKSIEEYIDLSKEISSLLETHSASSLIKEILGQVRKK